MHAWKTSIAVMDVLPRRTSHLLVLNTNKTSLYLPKHQGVAAASPPSPSIYHTKSNELFPYPSDPTATETTKYFPLCIKTRQTSANARALSSEKGGRKPTPKRIARRSCNIRQLKTAQRSPDQYFVGVLGYRRRSPWANIDSFAPNLACF